MHRKSTALIAALAAATTILALADAGSAATLKGVVVHTNARTQSFVIADRHGHLSAVHAKRSPRVGRTVAVTARRLLNGTWAATAVRLGRSARTARLRGTVTYVSTRTNTFVVSARGVSVLVRRHNRIRAAAAEALPAVGSVVTIDASVSGTDVNAEQVTQTGHDGNGIDLEGTILAIDTAARTISLSADDSDQSGAALTVAVPATFDLTQFQVGEAVELIASLNPDGTYTLEQSSNDGGAAQAGNPQDQQGNAGGDQQPSAAALCQAEQSDPNFPATHNGVSFIQYYADNPSEPSDAFARCVDAKVSRDGSQPSIEQQCLAERSDPSFPATHNGETFVQFYSPNPNEPNPGDAYGHCRDVKHQQAESSGSTQSHGDAADARSRAR